MCICSTNPMNTPNNQTARLTFTSATDFKAACKSANRNLPGTWEQLARLLIETGHGDALNDVLPRLSSDSGRKIVRPNNARECETLRKRMMRSE